MQIDYFKVVNFASYSELEFTFSNQGLVLIQGLTGSGKSTFMDAIPWIIFGVTAKDGNADEVRSWFSKEDTTGVINISLNHQKLSITRVRGTKNDLYYTLNDQIIRGTNIQDTQKKINSLLNTNFDTYLSSSYYHEFSKSSNFFLSNTKARKDICEQLLDLSLIKKLQLAIKDKKSDTNIDIKKYENIENTNKEIITILNEQIQHLEYRNKEKLKQGEQEKTKLSLQLDKAINEYEQLELLLKTLSQKTKNNLCKECGSPKDKELVKQLNDTKAKLQYKTYEISDLDKKLNNFKVILDTEDHLQIKLKQAKTNYTIATNNLTVSKNTLGNIEVLENISVQYRITSLTNTVSYLEAVSNHLLTSFYDSILNITLTMDEDEKLDLTIYKDGNLCTFTQLSKGQRCILRLCFGVAIMKASLKSLPFTPNILFFDEALTGLDSELKIKSFKLFEHLMLEYKNIFVIDHDTEIKSLFNTSYEVKSINGVSELYEKT